MENNVESKQLKFQDVFKGLIEHPFRSSGRASRSEFWLSAAAITIAAYILYFLMMIIVVTLAVGMKPTSHNPWQELSVPLIGFGLLFVILFIALEIVYLCVLVRRLHDTGRSGWYLLVVFVPIIGPFILLAFTLQISHPDNEYGVQPFETR